MNRKKSIYYLNNKKNDDAKLFKTEILLTPILILIPFLVGFYLIYDWYIRDIVLNELDLFTELLLGLIIIFGNLIFDIPLIRSLIKFSSKKKIKK